MSFCYNRNLQTTPLDRAAVMKVHAKTDDFMELVMAQLGLPIPPFILTRRVLIQHTDTVSNRFCLNVKFYIVVVLFMLAV
jgi:mono-ADP-ribosyltransferase sirtuin 6